MPHDLTALKDIAGIVDHLATVCAIVVGGLWTYLLFVRKRQRFPRAKVEHQVTPLTLTNGGKILTIAVTVSNSGDVLLKLEDGTIYTKQILPASNELLRIMSEQAVNPRKGRQIGEWYIIAEQRTDTVEIEPGESHQFVSHYFTEFDVQVVLVQSYFQNESKKRRIIGWPLITIHDLRAH